MLETLDLDREVEKDAFRKAFPPLQERLRALQYELQRMEVPTVLVFEGVDAAGKGTTISRLVERLDPRLYRVVPSTPPSEEERGRHFLWRYQMKLPADGTMTVFDRSWYGRVLVERIDGGLSDDLVRRACTEIKDFERWLSDDGQVLVKVWLHISRKTQGRRLRRLESDPLTAWKVSEEDWEHHEDYDRWIGAAEQVFTSTDTPYAPWTLVSAEDKRACRLDVIKAVVRRMEEALARRLADPKSVSRTTAGEAWFKEVREKMIAELSPKAREEAAAAGLPLEERHDPVRGPAARKRAGRRAKARPSRKGR
jgi:polyphosphate kinase 2 (PPK2 family)